MASGNCPSQGRAMIISPPFLITRNTNETDDAWLARAMPVADSGSYPVSDLLGWHGGMHLRAPSAAEPIRAIADGKAVYVRQPTARSEDHVLNYLGWTDDGCVVLQHDTAIGADDATETEVRFYSIYMHLNTIRSPVKQGEKIYRKTVLGTAGSFEGNDGIIHFEIICNDADLKKLIGRNSGDLDTGKNGRTDAIFGEIFFKLPDNSQVYAERPALNQATGTGGVALGEELYIGIRYGAGNAVLITYKPDGTTLGNALTETDAEYKLYATAKAIATAYNGRAKTPIHSAIYELLRFGRVVGPDKLEPADTPHWRKINTPTGGGWVNLNAAGVTKSSDADAPHWAGWHLLNDYQANDSRCAISTIKKLLDANGDGINTREEAASQLKKKPINEFLAGTICKFPTEWQKSTIATRWSWTTKESPQGALPQGMASTTYLSQKDFAKFRSYAEALCFWDDANLEDIEATHWHLHPVRFIKIFGRNLWLTKSDLGRIYKRTSEQVREKYRLHLNSGTRKYLYINNPLRVAHFLGQGAVESTFLQVMQEKSMTGRQDGEKFFGEAINQASGRDESELGHWYGAAEDEVDHWYSSTKYNSKGGLIASSYNWRGGNLGDPDAQKYRGRGFKQLTGLYNYSRYWVYRGWLDKNSYDEAWTNDPGYRSKNRAAMRLRPPVIDDPQKVTAEPYNCLDSGAWYLCAERPETLRRIDEDGSNVASSDVEKAAEERISRAVTRAINGGEIQWKERLLNTRAAKDILL
ncbi:peptidoglycan DD-metalloendopeptidase family protein [Xanthomonas oryzae pv. oryzicola]|nr:peptidoglycan DD-metalloendopeptidase family protein [Xanthomonas oryzae pv. oryzicola]